MFTMKGLQFKSKQVMERGSGKSDLGKSLRVEAPMQMTVT